MMDSETDQKNKCITAVSTKEPRRSTRIRKPNLIYTEPKVNDSGSDNDGLVDGDSDDSWKHKKSESDNSEPKPRKGYKPKSKRKRKNSLFKPKHRKKSTPGRETDSDDSYKDENVDDEDDNDSDNNNANNATNNAVKFLKTSDKMYPMPVLISKRKVAAQRWDISNSLPAPSVSPEAIAVLKSDLAKYKKVCPVCDRKFVKTCAAKWHFVTSHPSLIKLTCTLCCKKVDVLAWEDHLLAEHYHCSNRRKRRHICCICKVSPHLFLQHLLAAHSNLFYASCGICLDPLGQALDFYNHFHIYHFPYTQSHFSATSNNVQTDLGYSCIQCSKAFPDRKSLALHLLNHELNFVEYSNAFWPAGNGNPVFKTSDNLEQIVNKNDLPDASAPTCQNEDKVGTSNDSGQNSMETAKDAQILNNFESKNAELIPTTDEAIDISQSEDKVDHIQGNATSQINLDKDRVKFSDVTSENQMNCITATTKENGKNVKLIPTANEAMNISQSADNVNPIQDNVTSQINVDKHDVGFSNVTSENQMNSIAATTSAGEICDHDNTSVNAEKSDSQLNSQGNYTQVSSSSGSGTSSQEQSNPLKYGNNKNGNTFQSLDKDVLCGVHKSLQSMSRISGLIKTEFPVSENKTESSSFELDRKTMYNKLDKLLTWSSSVMEIGKRLQLVLKENGVPINENKFNSYPIIFPQYLDKRGISSAIKNTDAEDKDKDDQLKTDDQRETNDQNKTNDQHETNDQRETNDQHETNDQNKTNDQLRTDDQLKEQKELKKTGDNGSDHPMNCPDRNIDNCLDNGSKEDNKQNNPGKVVNETLKEGSEGLKDLVSSKEISGGGKIDNMDNKSLIHDELDDGNDDVDDFNDNGTMENKTESTIKNIDCKPSLELDCVENEGNNEHLNMFVATNKKHMQMGIVLDGSVGEKGDGFILPNKFELMECSVNLRDIGLEYDLENNGIVNLHENHNLVSSSPNSKNTSWACDTCEYVAKDKKSLNLHRRNVHDGKRCCKVCNKTFRKKYCFDRHMMSHITDSPVPCHLCGKMYKHEDSLKDHMIKVHTEDKSKYRCEFCSFGSNVLKDYESHLDQHVDVVTFTCDLCTDADIKFNSKVGLEHHKHLHHRQRICSICNFVASDRNEMINHRKNLHPVLKCKKCGYVAKSKFDRDQHRKGHMNQNITYVCETCGQSFNSAKTLKYHKDRHIDSKPLHCDMCDYKCSSKSSMTDHRHKHFGHKPYVCDVCGFSCYKQNGLKSHRATHSDEFLYKCDRCGKGFKKLWNYKLHLLIHTGQKRFKCRFCPFGAQRRDALIKHKKFRHADLLDFDEKPDLTKIETAPASLSSEMIQ